MKKILLVFIFTITCFSLAAQRPRWISKTPIPTNDSYLYNVEFGIGNTPNEAENDAYTKQFRFAAMTMKVSVDIKEIINSLQKGTDYNVISQYYTIPISKVCEYIEKSNDGYCVFILCQVAKSSITHQFDNSFNDCTDHSDDWRALGLSVFPGGGQFYKNHNGLAWTIIGSEVLLIGGGVTCYFIGQNQQDIMSNHKTSYNDYQSAKSTYKTVTKLQPWLYGVAAVVYVANLASAYWINDNRDNKSVTFVPAIMPTDNDLAISISANIKF